MAIANEVKFPHVEVQLSGEDGNAFFMIGRTIKELRRAGATTQQVNEFQTDAMSGDYDHVIQTIMKWVNVA
jgi:hypothetical protein